MKIVKEQRIHIMDLTQEEFNAIKPLLQPQKLIDLGLPSGTLWADRNLGADKIEQYGDYYRFGEVTPFTSNSPEYQYDKITRDISGTSRDAATHTLGDDYHIPTFNQINELINKCDWKWSTVNHTKGYLVIGPNGNSIFLPAAGFRYYSDDRFITEDSCGYYWSATPHVTSYGRILNFNSDLCNYGNFVRACGYSIRPVSN